jgi:hypothetical protein
MKPFFDFFWFAKGQANDLHVFFCRALVEEKIQAPI